MVVGIVAAGVAGASLAIGGLRKKCVYSVMNPSNPYGLPTTWSEVCSAKSVILGLKRYAFRREYSAAKLSALGYSNMELVDAFDGWEEGADVDGALKSLGFYFKPILNSGCKAFCYSQISLWKRMIDENIPFMTIFEDDCLGHLDLPNGLGQKFWDATPKNFDICYLGNMMNPADPCLSDPNALVVKSGTFTTHAYILTLQGAKTLWRLLQEVNSSGNPLKMLDIQMHDWQIQGRLHWVCWNGTWIQKSYPTYDQGLPWQAFSDVILPVKDSGLFWQNMRLGTTLSGYDLNLTVPDRYNTDT